MMIKSKFFLIVMIFFFLGCIGNSQIRNTKNHTFIIEKKSNELEIAYNYAPTLHIIGNNSLEIINKDRVIIVKKLFKNIEKKKEIVLSHILLSHIIESKEKLFLESTYLDKSGRDKLPEYIYNGLKWWQKNNDYYVIDGESYEFVKNYWKSKLK